VLASGGNDNMLILWNLSGNTRVKIENAHVGPVTSLAFISSGLLASGGHDGCVKRWAIE
jgi:WD40 repeat protein